MKRKTLTLKKKEAAKEQGATSEERKDSKEREQQDDIQEWTSEGGSLGLPALDKGEE